MDERISSALQGKEVVIDITTARLITDIEERRSVMSAPETGWYREFVDGDIDRLLTGSPMVEVTFDS
jgi:hypothetical protein